MCAIYIIRAAAVFNSTEEELQLRSDDNFPKRAQNIKIFQTIPTYTKDLVQTHLKTIEFMYNRELISIISLWEFKNANYDINYSTEEKELKYQHTHI